MWANAATRANMVTLGDRGVQIYGPGEGDQACGETGEGRMLEPLDLAARLQSLLLPSQGVLAGRRVLITAGPTRERIDPVRFISNRSSGKMGFAVAQAAREAGAGVVLVAGPVSLPAPAGVRRVDVESASEMLAAVLRELPGTDLFISTAAVADYRPARAAEQKIKKTSESLDIAMERTVDVLATVAAHKDRPFVVGFAAETESVEQNARTKLLKKNLDMIAANEVGHDKAFDCEDNQLIVLTRAARHELARAGKLTLARGLITLIAQEMAARGGARKRGTALACAAARPLAARYRCGSSTHVSARSSRCRLMPPKAPPGSTCVRASRLRCCSLQGGPSSFQPGLPSTWMTPRSRRSSCRARGSVTATGSCSATSSA